MEKKEVRIKSINQIFKETSLNSKGFKCTKKRIYLKEGDMKYSIDFGRAISPNRLEEVNYIEARANVSHIGLQKKMKIIYPNSIGYIGGSSIGNLFEAGPPWTNYDLGITEVSYNETVKRMKNDVENEVFRFFDAYSNIDNINNYFGKP